MTGTFQKQAAEFAAMHGLNTDLHTRVLDLVSEVGEAAKAVLNATSYGAEPFAPTDNWREELGDILFALACLANQTGVDLEAEFQKVLEKYQARLADSEDPGSGR